MWSKKTEYDKLVNKANSIDNTNFVSRTKYEKDGSDFEDKIDKIEKKIPDISNLFKKSTLIAVENKIPDISGLATKSALTAVENKIPDVSALVKKMYFNSKIIEIEGKIPSISGLATTSALTAVENKIPDVRGLATTSALIAIENKIPDITSLVTKTDFDAKLRAISDRVTKDKAKDLLLDNELKKLKTSDLDYFTGKSYFGSGDINYLIFEVSYAYLNFYDDFSSGLILSWKSKGVYKEIIKAPKSNNKILSPIAENVFDPQKIKLKFNGSCLIQDQITYTPQTTVNIYIVYEITKKSHNPALENCLFGSVKLIKNSDIDKYKYSGYGIGFDRRGIFCNFFVNFVNVLGKDVIQGLDNTTTYTEKMYSITFTKTNTKFCLSLHYNGSNSYLFVNGNEIHKFKTKNSEIIAAPICLGNISGDSLVDNMKKMASLAKWLSVRLRIKWLWVRVPLQSLKWVCL